MEGRRQTGGEEEKSGEMDEGGKDKWREGRGEERTKDRGKARH